MTGTDVGEKIALMVLPVASTASLSEPAFEFLGGETVLRFDVERRGERLRGGLR